jgi:VanZ family protein
MVAGQPDLQRLCQAWLPVLIWMLVIFLFSSQPYSGAVTAQYFGAYNVPVRKFCHGLEYALLYVLARRAFAMSGEWWHKWADLIGLVLSCIYALTDEWHQSFVPGRSASLSDAGIDSLGALTAWSFDKLRRTISNSS